MVGNPQYVQPVILAIMIVDWTPSDFAPTYRCKVEGDNVELIALFDIPPYMTGNKELTIDDIFRRNVEDHKADIIRLANAR